MKQFEITYTNGDIISGRTMPDWVAAPATGVQNITFLHDDDSAQSRLHGFDYYIYDGSGDIVGTDILMPGVVKEGELTEFGRFAMLRDSVFKQSRIWNRQPDTTFRAGKRTVKPPRST
jgi:hypothetical protein